MRRVSLEETTLRDGEQAPGVQYLPEERYHIASRLQELLTEHDTVDVGFPATSSEEIETIRLLASQIYRSKILVVSRMRNGDIDSAVSALSNRDRATIALIVPVSPLHREFKLGLSEGALLDVAAEAVSYARRWFPTVAVALEDATRTDIPTVIKVCKNVIQAGATVINVADTVGISDPWSYSQIFLDILAHADVDPNDVELGAHCHNDYGLATANSLAAVRAGACRVGCAFNGLGERAGNAATEEILLALHQRMGGQDVAVPAYSYDLITRISQEVAVRSGMPIAINKPVIGLNCFRHESGIHQDGMFKDAAMYQPFPPELVGGPSPTFSLGRNSSRRAVARKLQELGVPLDRVDADRMMDEYRHLMHRRKRVSDDEFSDFAFKLMEPPYAGAAFND